MTRLKSQITGLVWKFTSPEDFRRAVCELFDQYADRAYRAGEVVQAERRALAYHAPPLVLRQLELELSRHISENPEAALSAADALWKDAYLEPRLVAAFLLGQAPVDPPDGVLARLEAWCLPKEDRQALDGLFERGTERLRANRTGTGWVWSKPGLTRTARRMTVWQCAHCCQRSETGSLKTSHRSTS
jgi:hypothetical protein